MSVIPRKTVVLRDGAEVVLRSPREDEAQALIDYLKVVRAETDGIMSDPLDTLPTLEEERQWILKSNRNDAGIHLAAEADGEVIALGGIDQPGFVRQQHIGSLGISIRQQWCDRGLGTIIMQSMIDWARQNSTLELVTLTVFADNPRAQAVYRKIGFQIDGLLPRRAKVDGKYRDMIVMSLWLNETAVA